MKIDKISSDLIKLALYLDAKAPGVVSEIWIDKDDEVALKKTPIHESEINAFTSNLFREINAVTDQRRKEYLTAIAHSLDFQTQNRDKKISYSDFSEQAFGFRIERVMELKLSELEAQIVSLEEKLGQTRYEVLEKKKVDPQKYQQVFEEYVAEIKTKLPRFLSSFDDKGFSFELTTDKPWSAFNTHDAPFHSKLTLNADLPFDEFYLYRLACHEAYGGHHSELSLKDNLLIEEGRGEHGLVITFSPQTFISEAIAEGMYVLLDLLDQNNLEMMLAWKVDRLVFALQNLATFLCFDDGLSNDQIEIELKKYGVSSKVLEGILNFSTDPLFGKYAPVYYSAYTFIEEYFNHAEDKEIFVKELFTLPTTPQMLRKKN